MSYICQFGESCSWTYLRWNIFRVYGRNWPKLEARNEQNGLKQYRFWLADVHFTMKRGNFKRPIGTVLNFQLPGELERAVTNCSLTQLSLKETLNRSYKPWPSISFSFPTTIRYQIVIKLTSSSSKLSSEQLVTKTKTQIIL